MSEELETKCIICLKGSSSKNSFVKTVSVEKIVELLSQCKERLSLGENDIKPLVDRLSVADESRVRYHSECRKPIMNKTHVQRSLKRSLSESSALTPKVGRPIKIPSPEATRPKRAHITPKEAKCVFASCDCCSSAGSVELHHCETHSMGQTLLDIKNNTNSDEIRVCLSGLEELGDAAAQEKFYHRHCLRYAQRTCSTKVTQDKMVQQICEELLLLSVKSSLSDVGVALSMNEVNDEYVSILKEYYIHDSYSGNHKKHLKLLLKQHIPDIEFVKSVRKNESEKIALSRSVSQAMEYATSHSTSIDALLSVTKFLREEILSNRDWRFNTNLVNFRNPPILQFFLNQLLFGPNAKKVTGKRVSEVQKTVDVACQFLMQNTRTDRQVKHQPKKDEGFRSRGVETPLSIGLPLVMHSRLRDKNLIKNLTMACIGSDYQHILNIEKRIEQAVIIRMQETGGFCLPDFVRKGVNVWFAVDNIDLLEDTPYGQNTFHGTVIVLNQRENTTADPINTPLIIPNKLPDKPLQVTINYLEEPVIQKKPIRFDSYIIGQRKHLLQKYKSFTQTWMLTNYMANKESQAEKSSDASEEVENILEISPLPGSSQINQVDTVSQQDAVLDLSDLSSQNKTVADSIIQVTNTKDKKERRDKRDVMPTWSSTKSLLLTNKEFCKRKKTNTEAIAPLFRTSPTDYATLYTVLSLTQEISASIVGPDRRTLITLDLDLYNRAIQIQSSIGNKNWILRAGVLHVAFASLHALGKTIEGSGADTCAIETGTYSSAALRGIYGGKAFKRGVEYHIINALAIMMLKLDALISGDDLSEAIKSQCINLKTALHDRHPTMLQQFEAIQSHYEENVQEKLETKDVGELAQFLNSYLEQIESLLEIISSCRQEDWKGYLAALENGIKYFFAHDLLNYARLMPLHIAQMNALEKEDPATWEALKSGEFVVNKSGIPFTSLFTDQALEQEIKNLKRHGGIVGISQNEDALSRMMHTTPHLARIVKEYLHSFPSPQSKSHSKEHYQLSGSFALRSTQNAMKLKSTLELRCDGNPFVSKAPLRSIVSSAIIPPKAKDDILNYAKLGQGRYAEFVEQRLLVTSKMSIWDKMTKMKAKTFSNWMAKTRISVGDKVIKLREERQLFARFLIIQQSRPELVPKLEATIGNYEMAVIPRSIFALDGSLLICKDKASFMHVIEGALPETPSTGANSTEDSTSSIKPVPTNRVLIVDAMAVLQGMKKLPGMTKICHLKEAFLKKIGRMANTYDEARIVFDRYIEDSLKTKTRASRAVSTTAATAGYQVHDEMSIKTISMKELLSSSKTKSGLTKLLSEALLNHFEGEDKKFIISYDTFTKVNSPHTIEEDFKTHSHEEADTLIPLHVIDSLRESMFREIHVRSPDTDVLVLLMDLVSKGHLGALTELKFCTGTGAKYREIDVPRHVEAVGQNKARGLIGLHNFSGADWGGKFVGISKKTWIDSYLSLPNDDIIIDCFCSLGEGELVSSDMQNGELPSNLKPLETFVCKVYSPNGPATLPELRWELFRSKNLEAELLPPTRTTLLPHILRTNFISIRDKSYNNPKSQLPELGNNGWVFQEKSYVAVRCLSPPAPKAVLELVKCGCKTACKGQCSCAKNKLPCTALCKCFSTGCNIFKDYYKMPEDDKEWNDEEDDDSV